VALRLHPALRRLLPASPAVGDLLDAAVRHNTHRIARAQWTEHLRNAANTPAAGDTDSSVGTLQSALKHLVDTGFRIEPYPDRRGVVLTGRGSLGASTDWFLPPTDDGEDAASVTRRTRAVRLDDHTQHVMEHMRHALERLPLNPPATLFEQAAALHDLGKADERFQAVLDRTDRTDAWLLAGVTSSLLAKSDAAPLTRAQQVQARERAGLPAGFRHEMLSVQLAEFGSELPEDEHEHALLLHLIAAHHGYARPFAPVVPDDELPAVEVGGIELTHDERARLTPPHRIDSGIADRFWQLNRRYGWWGLPYLEAVLRLADQQASAAENAGTYETSDSRENAEVAS
jgi:CRISPR-associated endonuclease/helicase Cas3